jgi:hypothetical protein
MLYNIVLNVLYLKVKLLHSLRSPKDDLMKRGRKALLGQLVRYLAQPHTPASGWPQICDRLWDDVLNEKRSKIRINLGSPPQTARLWQVEQAMTTLTADHILSIRKYWPPD